MSYCSLVRSGQIDEFNRVYHDTEYGFPVQEDSILFERLVLEINQAGLSWLTILKKRAAFRSAYAGFDLAAVASFGEKDRERLMMDARIIRNRLKIEAAITNAKVLASLREEHGSFAGWLDSHHPAELESWTKIFKQTFVFTGGEIVREFLVSTGYLPAAHDEDCPVYRKIEKLNPPWRIIRDKRSGGVAD